MIPGAGHAGRVNVRRPLLLAVLVLLGLPSIAVASDGPAYGYAEEHYLNHDVAVLTAAFVAQYNDLTRQSDVSFTCSASQPALGARLVCTVHSGGKAFPYADPSPAPTGLIAQTGSFPGDDDAVRVCASLSGSSVPPACA